jgi:AcrR family transcriptional regulator
VPRPYRKTARAETEGATRQRIVAAAVETIRATGGFGIREIAAAASVTVQTIYSHFGSKGGLVAAVVYEVTQTEGLTAGLSRVWTNGDGPAALAEMIAVTFGFWNRAWPFISTAEALRIADHEFEGQMAVLDASRIADLERICARLEDEGFLREGLTVETAAALVFAMTAPSTYRELVSSGRMTFERALPLLKQAGSDAVVRPGRRARRLGPPAWARGEQQEPFVAERPAAG